MNRSIEKPPHLPSSVPLGAAWHRAHLAEAFAGPAADHGNLIKKAALLLVIGVYVATLLWAYATIVSPAFADYGFTLRWPSAVAMVWFISLALLPAVLLPNGLSRPSAVILWWLYLSVYIPSILVPPLSLSMPFEELLPLQLSLLLCMGLLCLASSGRPLAVSQIVLSPTVFWPAFLLAWGGCLAYLLMNVPTSVLLSNLASVFEGETVYAIRSWYGEVIQETGRGLAYMVGQLANALNPFLIAFGLVSRRRMCLVAGILGQIIVFSLTGFRASLLSVGFLTLLALIIRRWRKSFGLAFASMLIATVLIAAAIDRAGDGVYFSSVITRRTLLVPGLLTGFYFEHYSRVSPVGIGFHLSHDEAFFGPAREIGFVYMGSADTNANANAWAEGFAEFGVPGMLGYTILVAFMIWIYDSISARRDLALAVLLAAMPAIMLSNTAPTTVLISHGGLAAALVLYFAPSPEPVEGFEPEIEREEGPLAFTAETSV